VYHAPPKLSQEQAMKCVALGGAELDGVGSVAG